MTFIIILSAILICLIITCILFLSCIVKIKTEMDIAMKQIREENKSLDIS